MSRSSEYAASLSDLYQQQGSNAANSLQQQAQARANAVRDRGQLIGNSLSSLGQLVQQLPQQIAQRKRQALEDQNLGMQTAMHGLQLQGVMSEQQKLAAVKALRQKYNGDTEDPGFMRELGDIDQEAALALEKNHLEMQKQRVGLANDVQAGRITLQQAVDHAVASADPNDPSSIYSQAKVAHGLDPKFDLASFSADPGSAIKAAGARLETNAERTARQNPGLVSVSGVNDAGVPGTFRRPANEPGFVPGVPPTPPRPVAVKTMENGKEVTMFVLPEAGQSYPAPPPPPSSAATTNTSDVKETIAGMMDGTLPPIMPGRASKDYDALMAEAHRQGFNLAGAATDWLATQKHIATMNGAQQLRLNQGINALPELLDSVDALAAQWKGGRFPILNKANLAAAKGGAYGPDVASVANRLETQIADVVADLGNVYMGGNSPTDSALKLAQTALSADWDARVLKDMVKQAKANVQIRRNSINNTGVAGASENNPYVPPTTSGGPRQGEQRQAPNGQLIQWDGIGWKVVGR